MKKKTVSAIMLTLLFVSLLSLVLNVGIAYDSGTMSGKVTESDGVTPIVGALVEALQQGDLVVSSTTTGAGGIYFLPLPVGAYKLRVSANNRITATKPVVTVTADTTTTVDFKLSIGQMLVFDEFMGTSLNTSKWNSHLTGLARARESIVKMKRYPFSRNILTRSNFIIEQRSAKRYDNRTNSQKAFTVFKQNILHKEKREL